MGSMILPGDLRAIALETPVRRRPGVSPLRVGVTLGAFSGSLHLAWALLVAAGLAQPLIDLIFRLHFLRPVYQVTAFDLGQAALLLLFTSLAAGLMGLTLALVWNMVMRERR